MERSNLVDVIPLKHGATWRNKRSGLSCVSKRLDHFLLAEALASRLHKYRFWIEASYIYDHHVIGLQIDEFSSKVQRPFKLNNTWLQEPDFCLMARNVWCFADAPKDLNPLEAI